MKSSEDVGAQVKSVLEATGLKGHAEKALGASKKPVRLAAGEVTAVGLSFFDKARKPQAVYEQPGLPLANLAQSLIAQEIYQFAPAYKAEVKVGEETHSVFLSEYHTKRMHGEAPELRKGDVVDVYVAPKEGGIAFTYTSLKGAK